MADCRQGVVLVLLCLCSVGLLSQDKHSSELIGMRYLAEVAARINAGELVIAVSPAMKPDLRPDWWRAFNSDVAPPRKSPMMRRPVCRFAPWHSPRTRWWTKRWRPHRRSKRWPPTAASGSTNWSSAGRAGRPGGIEETIVPIGNRRFNNADALCDQPGRDRGVGGASPATSAGRIRRWLGGHSAPGDGKSRLQVEPSQHRSRQRPVGDFGGVLRRRGPDARPDRGCDGPIDPGLRPQRRSDRALLRRGRGCHPGALRSRGPRFPGRLRDPGAGRYRLEPIPAGGSPGRALSRPRAHSGPITRWRCWSWAQS